MRRGLRGGFAIAAAVYLLGLERYRQMVRAAVLISFLGYWTVSVGMMYELGMPWRIWHPIVMWNRRSVLFEVSWCVMLYTTVLALGFLPPRWWNGFPGFELRKLYLQWHHQPAYRLGHGGRDSFVASPVVPRRSVSAGQRQTRIPSGTRPTRPTTCISSFGGASRVGRNHHGGIPLQSFSERTGRLERAGGR